MKNSGIPVVIFIFLLSSCSIKPKPITEGVDVCANCKMTIMEKQYAAEILTKKGRAYIFDDLKCMDQYLLANNLPKEEIKQLLVTDFYNPEVLLPADDALFFYSDELNTPMNGKTVALADSGDLVQIQGEFKGESKPLNEVIQ